VDTHSSLVYYIANTALATTTRAPSCMNTREVRGQPVRSDRVMYGFYFVEVGNRVMASIKQFERDYLVIGQYT